MSEGTEIRRGPLHGVKVIELATVVMAPYAAQYLGDLGANVIKVETLDGDSSRLIAGGVHPQLSGLALNLHRNKRSIAIDLKATDGLDAFRKLVSAADVLLTNVRPGALERMGLDYAAARDLNRELIYCDAHGFSSESGDADLPAFDDIIQAMTGLPDLVNRSGGEPRFMPILIADKVAGLNMVCGILAGLVDRQHTGEGQRIEVAMFDAILAFNLVEHLAGATVSGEPGYTRALTPTRGPHRTKDGWIALMPYTDVDWRRLYQAVDADDLLANPWHVDMKTRIARATESYGELKEIVQRRTTAEWLDIARNADIAAARVVTLEEIVASEADHRGVLETRVHPAIGEYRSIRPPLRFSSYTDDVFQPAPLIGEHSREVLGEVGLLDVDVERLIAERVIAEPDQRVAVAHGTGG